MLRDLDFPEFIACLRPGIQVGLVGGLGAGKTTFTARVLKYLGVQEPVTSPSFALCNEYEVLIPTIGIEESNVAFNSPESSVRRLCRLEHWDLYRLKSLPEELVFSCEGSESPVIRFIEWSDKFPILDCELDLKIIFEVEEGQNGDIKRRILW